MAQKESVASKDEITKSMCPLLLFLRFLGLDLTSSKPRCVILNVLHAIFSFIFIVYLVILSVQSVSGFGEKYEIGFMYYFMRATSVFLYISWTASYLQLAWHRNNFNTFFEMLQTFMSTITENKQKLCRKAKILSFLLLIYNFIILIFTLLSGYNNILNGLTENICYPPKLIIAAVGKRASCMVEFSWLICSQGYLKIVYSFITFLFCVISFHLSFCFKFIRDEAATLKSKLAYNSTRATELMKKYSIATDLVQMFDKLYEEIIFGCISMELGEIIVYSRLLSDKKHIAVKVLYMYEICTSVFCMFILFIAASFVNSEVSIYLHVSFTYISLIPNVLYFVFHLT